MSGPSESRCECKYPDAIAIEINMTAKKAIINCCIHGTYEMKLPDCFVGKDCKRPIPTKEWREKERQKLGIYDN